MDIVTDNSKVIEGLEARIAELEKELNDSTDALKAFKIIFTFGSDVESVKTAKQWKDKFALEQQAKGVLDAVKYLGWEDIYTDTCPNMNIGREFRFVAGQLTKEAKALKECM